MDQASFGPRDLVSDRIGLRLLGLEPPEGTFNLAWKASPSSQSSRCARR
jgi:hypothetical protein